MSPRISRRIGVPGAKPLPLRHKKRLDSFPSIQHPSTARKWIRRVAGRDTKATYQRALASFAATTRTSCFT